MLDQFNRRINYLRISVTDRCNLRCTYCMPENGIPLISHKDILSFDEIADATKFAVEMGITKIRVTGGEPLVRKGIVNLIQMLSQIKGIEDLSITTNGILLGQYAHQLKNAGLHRVNISLDTLNPEKFLKITRIGNVHDVLRGIDAVIAANLTPIKINCVIDTSPNEPDAKEIALFCSKKGLEVRYIYKMNLENGHFNGVIGGDGGKCNECNRLRMSADGKLKPCLFSNLEFEIRKLGIKKAFESALKNKPEYGTKNLTGKFYNIGG